MSLPGSGPAQSFGEPGGVDLSDDAQVAPFVTARGEEQDRRRTEQVVAVQQAALGRVAFGDVEAQQAVGRSRACTVGSVRTWRSMTLQLMHQSAYQSSSTGLPA